MKEFCIKDTDKKRFVESVYGHHISEIGEPFFYFEETSSTSLTVVKYHKYRVDIMDEEYVFLKLMFDIKEFA